MIYVASPYSHPDVNVQHERYLKIMEITAQLMLKGLPVFSPIVHCHEITLRFDLPGDAAYWQAYNTAFLRKATAVYVVMLEGWSTSKGVAQEMALAEHLNIPLHTVDLTGFIGSAYAKLID